MAGEVAVCTGRQRGCLGVAQPGTLCWKNPCHSNTGYCSECRRQKGRLGEIPWPALRVLHNRGLAHTLPRSAVQQELAWLYVFAWTSIIKVGRGIWEDRRAAHEKAVGVAATIEHLEFVSEAKRLERYLLEQMHERGWAPVHGREWFPHAALPDALTILDPMREISA